MAAAIGNMDDEAAFFAFEHDVSERLEALGASDVNGLMQSALASNRQFGRLCSRTDKRGRAAQYDRRWPAFARTGEDDPDYYEPKDQGHLPWYQRVPVSFVAAHDAVTVVEGLKVDFETRGRQIKESLGGRATTGQIALAFKEDAQARLQQTASAVAPLLAASSPPVDQATNALRVSSYHKGQGSTDNNQICVAFACVDAKKHAEAGNVS